MGLGFDLAGVLVARGPVHEGLDGPDLPPGVHIVISVSQSGKFYTSGSVPLSLGLGFTPPLPQAPIPMTPCAPLKAATGQRINTAALGEL